MTEWLPVMQRQTGLGTSVSSQGLRSLKSRTKEQAIAAMENDTKLVAGTKHNILVHRWHHTWQPM